MNKNTLLAALVWLIICIASCWDTNRDIDKIADPDHPSKIRHAPVIGLSIVAVVLLVYIIAGG